MLTTTNKSRMVAILGKVVHSAAKTAVTEAQPMVISRKKTLVGSLVVEKEPSHYYCVCRSTDSYLLYSGIALYETAILVAQSYVLGKKHNIKYLLGADQDYTKHRTDMVHYLECYKRLKESSDIERMQVLEDRFDISEEYSKIARQTITEFKSCLLYTSDAADE